MRRSIVSKLIRSIAKRRRARINAKKKNLEITQAKNIEQFESENNEKLFDNVDDDDSIDSLSLLANFRVVSQTIFKLFSINNESR